MSNPETKEQRSKRMHKEGAHIQKQLKIAKTNGITDQDKLYHEPHRFAKHHAMDCGNPGCPVCSNPRKLYKEETKQEKSFKQKKLHDDDEEYGED